MQKRTWVWALVVFIQACLIGAGIAHLLNEGLHAKFQAWRLCFFLATLPWCWLGAKFLLFLLIKVVEKVGVSSALQLYLRPLIIAHMAARWAVDAHHLSERAVLHVRHPQASAARYCIASGLD